MLIPAHKTQFFRDLKRVKKQEKPLDILQGIMNDLIAEKPLDQKYKDHFLKGNYKDCRECHIEPDWLLIYLVKGDVITFIRTGSHSELFK